MIQKFLSGLLILLITIPSLLASTFPYNAFKENTFKFQEFSTKNQQEDLPPQSDVILKKANNHQNISYHKVRFTMTGFSPSEITIDIGEEIMWINDRKNVKAMVQGTREHRHIISTILDPGESFTYTPTIAGRYIFIDAVVTSHVLKVNVGEFADRNW